MYRKAKVVLVWLCLQVISCIPCCTHDEAAVVWKVNLSDRVSTVVIAHRIGVPLL